MNCDVDWVKGGGVTLWQPELIIKSRRGSVTSFNAHAGIYLPLEGELSFWTLALNGQSVEQEVL